MPGRRRALGAVEWESERSEDSATGETEGGHAEPRATCRLARTTLVAIANTGPHPDHRMQAECLPDKEEIPRIVFRENPYSGWFMPKDKPQFLEGRMVI